MIVFSFFIVIAAILSYIDIKKMVVPDKIILPAIGVMIYLEYLAGSLTMETFIAVVIIAVLFMIPVILGMAFGGGDIRFGVFCALFLGLQPLGVFLALSGVMHLIILGILRKQLFGFVPAMSIAAVAAYFLETM